MRMKIIQICKIKYKRKKKNHLIIIVGDKRDKRKEKKNEWMTMIIDRNMTLSLLFFWCASSSSRAEKFSPFFLHCIVSSFALWSFFSLAHLFLPMAYIDYLFVCVPSLNTTREKREATKYEFLPVW